MTEKKRCCQTKDDEIKRLRAEVETATMNRMIVEAELASAKRVLAMHGHIGARKESSGE